MESLVALLAAGLIGTAAPSPPAGTAASAPSLEPSAPLSAEQMRAERRRSHLRSLHRGFGIATWTAMTATLVLGAFEYHDEYGFFIDRSDTPCARGEAVFGQWQCDTPILHLSMGVLTAALYATTFALSVLMRDRTRTLDPETAYGRRLRSHRILRWVHLAGMAGQVLHGVILANLAAFGVDREDNHRALQGVATFHMAVGLVTWAALTWAGSLMIF